MMSKHGLVDNNMKRSSCLWSLRKAFILHGIDFRYDRIDRLSRWFVVILVLAVVQAILNEQSRRPWHLACLPLRIGSLQGSLECCDNHYHSVYYIHLQGDSGRSQKECLGSTGLASDDVFGQYCRYLQYSHEVLLSSLASLFLTSLSNTFVPSNYFHSIWKIFPRSFD